MRGRSSGPSESALPPRATPAALRSLGPFLAPYAGLAAGAFAAILVATGTVLGIGAGLRIIVDKGFGAGDPALLDRGLMLLIGAVLLLAGATYARSLLVARLGERLVADLREAAFGKLVRLGPSFFETTRSGEILARLTADTDVLRMVIGSTLSMAVRNVFLLAGGTALMLLTSPRLTGLVALGIPLVVVPILVLGRRVRSLSRAGQDRLAEVSATADEALQGIRLVQAFGREEDERRRFAAVTRAALDAGLQKARARALLTALVIGLVFSAIGVVLWIGGHGVLAGHLSAGQLSAFIFYAVLVAGAVGALSETLGDLQRAAGATDHLMELMRLQPAIIATDAPRPLPLPARGEVRFDNVTFAYPARPEKPALQGVDFSLRAGERVAIVGPSGAGKSTLFQLLLRFQDPREGRVLLDGLDLRDLALADLRRAMALVPQDVALFSADAWHNIGYGKEGASRDAIENAARAAQIHEFLAGLPQGYATPLGARGVQLSGGQRQRIAIARALLRDPALLLLDEATSALDAASERGVQQALDALMKGRSTLVIAHRLATVAGADRILVLDQGRIVATGTHQSLLAQGGLYARLAALEFGKSGA